MLKNKTLISPSEILSNKLMNWCRKCSVPIHEKNVFLILNISPFSHKLQTRALLSGLLPYKPESQMVWSVMAPGSLPALQYGVKLLALLRSCAGNNMTPRGKLTCNLGVTKCSLKLNILYIYLITVGSRSLRDHTFKKLIYFSISVREGVWGIIFEFEGTSGGLCREFIFEFESPL